MQPGAVNDERIPEFTDECFPFVAEEEESRESNDQTLTRRQPHPPIGSVPLGAKLWGEAQLSTAKKKKKNSGTKDGLEECTKQILRFLQTRGRATFKEIHEALEIDYRRAYDILNVLMTTPLIRKEGKKRDPGQPYIYVDGTPLREPVDLDKLLALIETEQRSILTMQFRTESLLKELAKPECPDPAAVLETIRNEEQHYLSVLPPPPLPFPDQPTSNPQESAATVSPSPLFPPPPAATSHPIPFSPAGGEVQSMYWVPTMPAAKPAAAPPPPTPAPYFSLIPPVPLSWPPPSLPWGLGMPPSQQSSPSGAGPGAVLPTQQPTRTPRAAGIGQ
ncbi:hypothetical protein PAPYR_10433 [Paratrimastix pyriformis]|uniref:E2F/DP family winged-helix DNA-binding domain-containing protein n=1 Tax=Paratrimastix pyriformis TaxID=342808 RepID=A0ABQ8UD70_9EUKA|nr:hypothetical protein PAPYR_10433 [Paratrimastix pyriformis]